MRLKRKRKQGYINENSCQSLLINFSNTVNQLIKMSKRPIHFFNYSKSQQYKLRKKYKNKLHTENEESDVYSSDESCNSINGSNIERLDYGINNSFEHPSISLRNENTSKVLLRIL